MFGCARFRIRRGFSEGGSSGIGGKKAASYSMRPGSGATAVNSGVRKIAVLSKKIRKKKKHGE